MSPESFQYILNVVGPKIQKKRYQLQKSNTLSERLCLSIHYLAYGNNQQDLSFTYRIGRSTVARHVKRYGIAFLGNIVDHHKMKNTGNK